MAPSYVIDFPVGWSFGEPHRWTGAGIRHRGVWGHLAKARELAKRAVDSAVRAELFCLKSCQSLPWAKLSA